MSCIWQRALVATAVFCAHAAQATTVAITIVGRSDVDYELNVAGVIKTGRLGPAPDCARIRDLVEVGAQRTVIAGLTFLQTNGVVATCPEVEIKIRDAAQSCEPIFSLTDEPATAHNCTASCDPAISTPRRSDEEEEDEFLYTGDDTVYSQSFYMLAMSVQAPCKLYSSQERQ